VLHKQIWLPPAGAQCTVLLQLRAARLVGCSQALPAWHTLDATTAILAGVHLSTQGTPLPRQLAVTWNVLLQWLTLQLHQLVQQQCLPAESLLVGSQQRHHQEGPLTQLRRWALWQYWSTSRHLQPRMLTNTQQQQQQTSNALAAQQCAIH
jgi:hypothetical protein